MIDLETAARRVLKMLDDHQIRVFMGEDALDRIADLRTALEQPMQPCAWSLALQSLTPGGSEYVDDPPRCVAYVREARESQHRVLLGLVKRMHTERRLLDDALALPCAIDGKPEEES